TPIVIPPLDPTPENTPVVEVTAEVTEVAVEATETPVVEVTAEVTEVAVEVTPETTPDVELTPELTPDVELTPEATPDVEVTPEVTETAIPLSLDEAEIAKLDGVIYALLEAYYGGDEEGARTFATENYLNWLEDGRLRVWVHPYAVENIPAIAATLLELGGEVLYLGDSSVDVIITLETLVEIARDGRIFAITLPVLAVPTSTGELENNAVGTPQLVATTGTGSIVPHTL
ncbi:MAG TPA: hypothetical protein PLZ51_28630, partial [Aggregatilineales bacterium]|nr:hypothetical protein [Aggregatilineales bacterium]